MSPFRLRKCRRVGVQKEIATVILRHIPLHYMTKQLTNKLSLVKENFCP